MKIHSFNLLIPSYAHAYLGLLEHSVVHLVGTNRSSTKDSDTFRCANQLEDIAINEALELVSIGCIPLLAVDDLMRDMASR